MDPVVTVKGKTLHIALDTSDMDKAPLSKSMKSRNIGSTHGNANFSVDGRTVQLGINCFVPAIGSLAPTEEERAAAQS